jgi:hypothetical protein
MRGQLVAPCDERAKACGELQAHADGSCIEDASDGWAIWSKRTENQHRVMGERIWIPLLIVC